MLLVTLPLGCTEVLKSPLASPQDGTSSSQGWCEHRYTFSTAAQVSTEQTVSRGLPGGGKAGPGSPGHPTTPSATTAAPDPALGTTLGTRMAAVGAEIEYVLPEPWCAMSTH